MWIVRCKDGMLQLFKMKPVRIDEEGCLVNDECHGNLGDSIRLDDNLFQELTWNDEHMEVGLFPIYADTDEEFLTTISLTTYETHLYTVKFCESKDYIENILKKYEKK